MSTNQPQLVQVYNPWQVDSVQAFLSLKCPECVFTSKYEDSFQDHAVKHHPLSAALYGGLIVSVPTVSDVKVEVAPNVIVTEVVEELGKGYIFLFCQNLVWTHATLVVLTPNFSTFLNPFVNLKFHMKTTHGCHQCQMIAKIV